MLTLTLAQLSWEQQFAVFPNSNLLIHSALVGRLCCKPQQLWWKVTRSA